MKYFFISFLLLVYTSPTLASSYKLNEPDTWSSKLLLDTCEKELNDAISVAIEALNEKQKTVAVLPESIGYQYFKVSFVKVEGSVATPMKTELELQYWTENDQHEICTRVEANGFIY